MRMQAPLSLLPFCKLLHTALEPFKGLSKEAFQVGTAPEIDMQRGCPNLQDGAHCLEQRQQPILPLC